MLNILSVKKLSKIDLELEFRKLLKINGFLNPRLHGYSYIIDVIVEAIMDNQKTYVDIMKNAVKKVASKNNKSVTVIARATLNAIEQSFLCDKTNYEAITDLYWDFLNYLYITYCPENEEYIRYKKVATVLKENGFVDRHLDGYFYLLHILCESIKNNDIPYKDITLTTYPDTAKTFNTKPSNIERCLRHSISKSNFKGEDNKVVLAELYEQLYDPSDKKIFKTISFVLKENGFLKKSLDGYNYLMSIFTKSLKENILPYKNMTTILYPKIAEEYYTDWGCIERGIRTAISQSNFKGIKANIVMAELYEQITDLYYNLSDKEADIKKIVKSVLKDNGFSKIYLDGYHYLVYILTNAIITDTRPYNNMSTVIYPNTAKKFNVTETSVESPIYDAIKKSSLSNMTVSEAINKLYEEILIKISK